MKRKLKTRLEISDQTPTTFDQAGFEALTFTPINGITGDPGQAIFEPDVIKWTQDQLRELVGHYHSGYSINQMADNMGLSPDTIRNKLNNMGYSVRGRNAEL